MEDLNKHLNRFQVTIYFEKIKEEALEVLPPHRDYINGLIEKSIIEYYSVSFETMRAWILFSAETKEEVEGHLIKAPLYKFWKYEIDTLFLHDAQTYRLPVLQFN